MAQDLALTDRLGMAFDSATRCCEGSMDPAEEL